MKLYSYGVPGLRCNAMAERTRSIDILRGTAMVLMVLDHARDFFVGVRGNATNLATTTVPLFFTRWVTHFCAPVFVLLAGTAAYLHSRKHGLNATRYFLWTRGLWLILLELTVVRFAWIPDPFYHFSLLQVIWALGWSMLALSALSYLPERAVLAVGALIVALHNALDPIDARRLSGVAEPLWDMLHKPAMLHLGARGVYESYPVLPWIGVIALGFGLGPVFEMPPAERQRRLLGLGLAAVVAFVVLRG
ncbi:MAG TPA: heparan-alpha-glucosaminide N-acetyltransferase domain-containing protein, partial [Polyangiaceae bacterium]|nr:heparan-alpha-glucosaminide N-acetyltransferase domain-containing protein [Polyangiaceae bacterium]